MSYIDKIKSVIEYNQETGVFTWKVKRGCMSAGSVAGSLQSNGYLRLQVLGDEFLAHRLAFLMMTGSIPDEVDHLDGDRINNSWSNLRAASRTENCHNTSLRVNNKSGFKNVNWHPGMRKWEVQVRVEGMKCRFGYYDDIELADLVAQEVRSKYHKEFARS